MRRMLAGDWLASVRIAGTALGSSLLLAILFGLTSRPSSGGPHWGLKTTIAWVTWVWESIFGVDATGHLRVSGSVDVLTSSVDGSATANGWIAAMPLTLTVITLVATGIAFRRATATYASAAPALLVGLGAALLTAATLVVIAWSISLNTHDVTDLGANRSSQWQSLDKSLTVSLSATDAFFVSLGLLVALFGALALLRADWLAGPWRTAHLLMATPLRAFARLGVGLVGAGLLFELVIWQVRWHTHWPGTGHRPSLTAHEWVNAFATAIAYAGNAGAMALGLGSFGQVGTTASGSATAASFTQSGSTSQEHWIGWFAQSDQLSYGVWIGMLLAPALIAAMLWPIVRAHRAEVRDLLAQVGIWLVSLVIAVPVITTLANLAAGGGGSANATVGSFSFDGAAHGSASAGLAMLVSTFAVFAYAVMISAVVVAATTLRLRRTSAAGTDRRSAPQ